MAALPCTATVRGTNSFSTVNVRAGAGTHTAVVGTLPVGTTGLKVLEVRPDELQKEAQGKVYQWLRLEFPDGKTGWVRDDLVEIVGECTVFGYGLLASKTHAFALTRVLRQPPTDEAERIRKAAFNITAGFEGIGYGSYQNTDSGIVSFGRFQFTLASGSLFSVIDKYLIARPTGALSDDIRNRYFVRIRDRDASLRSDTGLREVLQRAALDPLMQQAQDQVATDVYWLRIQNLSIVPRGIRTPLGQAMFFDMGINNGVFHNMIGLAEKALGVAPKSKVGENGTTEHALVTETAKIRSERMNRIADQQRLPGLRTRGDFWVNLIAKNDWELQGDANGEVLTSIGRKVQVRTP